MATIQEAFFYLPVLYGTFIGSYLIGHLLTVIFAFSFAQPRTAVFCKLLLGVVVAVVAYSTWQRQGLTVLLLFVPLGLGLLFLYFLQRKTENKVLLLPFLEIKSSQIGFYLLVPFAYFLFRLFCLADLATNKLYVHWGFQDHLLYVRRAAALPIGENISAAWQWVEQTGTVPYHYFELWLLHLLTQSTQLLSVLLYDLVLFPFFLFVALLGYLSVYEQLTIKNKTRNYVLASLLVLAVTGYTDCIAFDFWKHDALQPLATFFHSFVNVSFIAAPYLLKLAVLKCFLLAFLVLWLQQQPNKALLVLLCLPIINAATTPVVVGGSIAFVLLNSRYRWLPTLQTSFILSANMLFSVAFALFYWLTAKQNTPEVATYWTFQNYFHSLATCFPAVFLFIEETFWHFAIYYLPFTVFVLVVTLQKPAMRQLFKNYWRLIGLFVAVALVVYAALWHIPDAHQIGKLLLFTSFETLFVLYLLAFVSVKNVADWAKGTLVAVAFVLIVVATKNFISREVGLSNVANKIWSAKPIASKIPYSPVFLQRVAAHLAPLRTTQPSGLVLGISLWAAEDFSPQYDLNYETNKAQGLYLNYMGNGFDLINGSLYKINYPDFWKKDQRLAHTIGNHPVIRFNKLQNQQNKTKWSCPQTLAELIKSKKIRFAVATPQAVIEPELVPLVRMEIKDERTGERFLLFR